MNMQDISNKMDESVRVLRDAFVHEQQEALLIDVAHSLVHKLALRDQEIENLKHTINDLTSQIRALRAKIDERVRLDGYSSEDLDE